MVLQILEVEVTLCTAESKNTRIGTVAGFKFLSAFSGGIKGFQSVYAY